MFWGPWKLWQGEKYQLKMCELQIIDFVVFQSDLLQTNALSWSFNL